MNNIFKIAIVEDNIECANRLKSMLDIYSKEKDLLFDVLEFNCVENFLSYSKNCFDLVFMDIDLPGMNGMEGARKLRESDSMITIIFVTNYAQFALKGYEVSALDFLLKPLVYKNFVIKLDRAFSIIEKRQDKKVIAFGKLEKNCMSVHDIIYIEVYGHNVKYHKTDGTIVEVTGTLSALAEELKEYGFSLCNSCFLVNMKYISKIKSLAVTMADGTELQISVRRRKQFVDDFTSYVGGGGN